MKYKLIAISFMMLILSCLANVVRSVNGAVHSRFSSVVEESVTAKDYIQNGLIGHWDGIENVGYGRHDSDSSEWIDLTGSGNNMTLTKGAYFLENRFETGTANSPFAKVNELVRLPIYSVEFIVDASRTSGFQLFGKCSSSKTKIFWFGIRANDTINFWSNGDCMQGTRKGINSYAVSIEGNFVRLFMNGEEMPNLGPGLTGVNEANITIGIGSGVSYRDYSIYSIRLYSRPLSPDEIALNHSIDQIRFNVP